MSLTDWKVELSDDIKAIDGPREDRNQSNYCIHPCLKIQTSVIFYLVKEVM